ncbi:MAG: hypothetical protein H0U24_04955 [Thermoleophilaceae bacterium]|nr:hypothetical protein [Thermoleophilaceae bacterium]
MGDSKRIDVGFQGGQMLAIRAGADALEKLLTALEDDKSGRWHTLETDESSVLIDLSQVVYVQRESGNQKVGF